MNKSFLKTLAISLLLLSIFIGNTADACRVKSYPWFITNTTIDTSTLPPGITFVSHTLNHEYGPDGKFTSTTTTPFYLLRPESDRKNEAAIIDGGYTELPAHEIPLYKLVGGDQYYWDGEDGWSTYYWYGTTSKKEMDLVLRNSDVGIKNKFGGKRPKNVEVPEPHDISFKAYYGSEPIYIKGRMEYALNEGFYPTNPNGCNNIYGSLTGLIVGLGVQLLIIGAIIFSPILLYKFLRKRISSAVTSKIIVAIYLLLVIVIVYGLLHLFGFVY